MLKSLTLTQTKIASIGEEIGLKLGSQMLTEYRTEFPSDVIAYHIGRNIIEQILSQPNCAGLSLSNGIDENGNKTLVYMGLDANGEEITKIQLVNGDGTLITKDGIVADRSTVIRDNPTKPKDLAGDSDDWGWIID